MPFPQKPHPFVRALPVLLLLCVPRAALSALSDFAPEETLLYLEARNLSDLQEKWDKTPYYRMWTNNRFDLFLKPMKKEFERWKKDTEKQYGIPYGELTRIFQGEIAVFRSEIRFERDPADPSEVYTETNSGFMARYRGDQGRIIRMIEDHVLGKEIPRDSERSVDTFKNVKIYTTIFRVRVVPERLIPKSRRDTTKPNLPTSLPRPLEPGTAEYHYEYAFVDDLCIILEGQRAFMKKILSNYFDVKEGRKASLSLGSTRNFRQALMGAAPGADVVAYANIERLIQQYRDDPNFTLAREMPGLKLEELHSAALTARLLPASLEVDLTVATAPSPRGVASLLIHESGNKFRSRRLAPSDAYYYTSIPVDVPAIYRLVDPESNPMFGILESTIQQETGVRVFEDLLKRMQGEIAVFERRSSGIGGVAGNLDLSDENRSTLLIELNQEEEFAQNFAKVMDYFTAGPMGMKFEPVEFQGFTIYTLQTDPAKESGRNIPRSALPKLSFAVADSFLVIGGELEEIKGVLRLVKGTARADLTRNENFSEMTKRLKPGYTGIQWYDLGKEVAELVKSVRSQPLVRQALGPLFDTANMPSPDTIGRFFGPYVGASYVTRDSFHFKGVLHYPKSYAGN